MRPIHDFENAIAKGEFDRMCQILERAATEGLRCRVKALMRRINKLVGLWIGED